MTTNEGKLIVFEGIDGSGKSTQVARLCQRLAQEGYPHRNLVFPQYDKPSSALIHMYLKGEFGTDPAQVNAYAASTFYAVDRFASFKKDWQVDYENGAFMVADRYTTSNAVHQTVKLPADARADYTKWLFDFEYEKMGIPAPDLVVYLDVPVETSAELIQKRANDKDIHEADLVYLKQCRTAALEIAKQYGWMVISAVDQYGKMHEIEEIHERIWQVILPYLK